MLRIGSVGFNFQSFRLERNKHVNRELNDGFHPLDLICS